MKKECCHNWLDSTTIKDISKGIEVKECHDCGEVRTIKAECIED